MGKLRFVALCLAFTACGSDKATPVDAAIDSPRPIDAKVFMDAPPVMYNFACYGMTPGTTVGDPIVVSGSAGAVSTSAGIDPLPDVAIDFYKVGSTTSAASTTSNAQGEYTSGNLTGGVAVDYIRGALAAHRTTYLFPPQPIRMTLPGDVPVPLVSNQLFGMVSLLTTQDENKGALLVTVTDCSISMPKLIDGATLHVQQNNLDVGEPFDVGQFLPEAAGTFFVFNVPEGVTQVWATYDGKTFPTRTVRAFKKPAGANAEGTISVTVMPPGPVY